MKLSKRAENIQTSLTRQLFNKAKQYEDVIDLTLGDPDLKPHQEICDAACNAIQEGKTRYSMNEARRAVAGYYEKVHGVKLNINRDVMLTIGGMGALYLSLAAIVNPGDEVIIIAPYYVNYIQMIQMVGGVEKVVWTTPKNNFIPYPDEIERLITENTIAIMINSPCNPTGKIIPKDILKQIAEIAIKNDLYVISDEVYNSLVYDELECASIADFPEMGERTIVIDSMSKRFSMTGYRAGFAVGPESVISVMTKMQENIASCTPLPSQYAAIEAYTNHLDDHFIRDTFEERRNFMVKRLKEIPLLQCNSPQAAFYLFVDISRLHMTSLEFAAKLLEAQHVAVVPGITYGDQYDDYIRIAFTLKKEKIDEALRRIKVFVESVVEG